MTRLRIAVGGMAHESNSFAPVAADLAAFHAGGIGRGDQLLRLKGQNLAIGGFMVAAEAAGAEIAPLLSCYAEPSAPVTREAFEALAGELLRRLADAGPVDALFLDLHGAMLLEDADDGEGELLQRVRDVVGDDLPVVCALDFHANVSHEMVRLCDGLLGYRTYPHIDLAETGRRAFAFLQRRLAAGRPAARARLLGAYLTPTVAQCTDVQPMARLQALSAEREAGDPTLWSCDLLAGFPLADTPCCGAAAVAYADTPAAAAAAAAALADAYAAAEPEFAAPVLTADEALTVAAEALARPGQGPVVLADTQDNPGGGGPGDTVGLLRALLARGVTRAALGVITDPQTASAAHAAGVGASLSVRLGAHRGGADEPPIEAQARVASLGDGSGVHHGPFLQGSHFRMGPAAALEIGGVTVIVSSHPVQCADREMFRVLGIDPDGLDIVAVKSSVHFRADFGPTARLILVVKTPGVVTCDHRELRYRRLRPDLRVMPGVAR